MKKCNANIIHINFIKLNKHDKSSTKYEGFAMDNFSLWKEGAKNGLPIFLGYVAVTFAFGVAARDVLTPYQAVLMSATNITSAGQFAALGLIAASVSYGEMALAQLVLNLRYSLMSCCISQKLESTASRYHRFFIAMGLTDEVFGLTASVKGRLQPAYAYGVMSTALPGWVIGTFLGIISTGFLPPRIMSALGIAIYGMFIAIIFPPVRHDHKLLIIVAVSIISSHIADNISLLSQVTPGIKLVGLTLVIASAAALLFPLEKRATVSEVHCLTECEKGAA
ncbi:AzlC family ABC transporter permease [Desulfovibrio sp. OttesenSCG-928-M16]|nr:AzlC family ABC transporter permease [Desulfovibrio sp. OttesenSCG-928-M16]